MTQRRHDTLGESVLNLKNRWIRRTVNIHEIIETIPMSNITFEQLLCESKRLYSWKNKWILSTRHGMERIKARLQIPFEEIKGLFKKSINKVLDKGLATGDYLFYSPELEYGYVGFVKPNQDIILITFLPKGRSNPKPGTEKYVVEGKEYNVIEL